MRAHLALVPLVLAFIPAVVQAAPIQLTVDATEIHRRVVHVREVLPVKSGAVALAYPLWIPGYHMPAGPLVNLVGLRLAAAGKPVAWQRDPVSLQVIRCQVPAGASTLEASFDVLLPASWKGWGSLEPQASPKVAFLQWHSVILLPEGAGADQIPVEATLRRPAGWQQGSALEVAREAGTQVTYRPVDAEKLVDSPVLLGASFRTVALDDEQPPRHLLHVAVDSPTAIEPRPATLKAWRSLVVQTGAMLGARPYRRYHFLLALSDALPPFTCIEHHESTELRFPERVLVDEERTPHWLWLAAHEYAHTWNGKHRRPRSLTTKSYSAPQRGDLLWVYEGLTHYLGFVLATRSGLLDLEQARDVFAGQVAAMDLTAGRSWRPLADTAVAAALLFVAPDEWSSWRRNVDYYTEGSLLWLEVDVLIRRLSGGKRSLDDFCRAFLAARPGPRVSTYELDEVLATLGKVAAHDWRGFFRDRVERVAPRAPRGVEASGWRVVYVETPSKRVAFVESELKLVMAADHALGLLLRADGTIVDLRPGSPARSAGLAPGMKLLGVNGRRWSVTALREALRGTRKEKRSIELLVEDLDHYRLHRLEHKGGERHPRLERDRARPDLLGAILAPRR